MNCTFGTSLLLYDVLSFKVNAIKITYGKLIYFIVKQVKADK